MTVYDLKDIVAGWSVGRRVWFRKPCLCCRLSTIQNQLHLMSTSTLTIVGTFWAILVRTSCRIAESCRRMTRSLPEPGVFHRVESCSRHPA